MASRFWVLGTGTWDSSTTTNWAASSGGAGGQSVPGSGDTVTFDGSSGGGTVTLNFGGTISVTSITMGAFTGTFDNSVHNNNITVSGNFSGSGSGTRTIKLGTATYTLTGNTSVWLFTTATNLTYTGNTGCTISFTGATGQRSISSASTLSHGNVIVGASSGVGHFVVNSNSIVAVTLNSLSITAPNYVEFPAAVTTTITNAFNWAGSAANPIGILSAAVQSTATVAAAGSSVASWASFRDMTFTGSPVASNSLNLGNNSGITINAPAGGAHFSAGF